MNAHHQRARLRLILAAFAAVAGALLASAGCVANRDATCNGGCLCYLTEATCPAGCYPSYQALDGGRGPFFCSNGPILPPNCSVVFAPVDGGGVTMACADAGDAAVE
jgi:hypothetical protein